MTDFVTAALAGAARDVSVLLGGACDITRTERTPSGDGGARTATVTVATGVPCKVSAAGSAARELVAGARQRVEVAYIVAVPAGTDVRSGDRLHLSDGRTLDVVAVPRYTTTVLTRAICVAAA